MAERVRLLVVEDDKKVASFIQKGLQEEHYAVDVVHDGASAVAQVEMVRYDLVILDLMLPKIPGLEVLRELRKRDLGQPVLILTARGTVEDRVIGLDLGADDYVVKPFAFSELSARVRAVLRRGERPPSEFCVADLVIDVTTRHVVRGNRSIELTAKEYALLEFLVRNAGRPVTRTMLVEHVWDIHFDRSTNVVDVHVNHLRNKIDKGFSPPLIHTVRGVGYILTDKAV
jgi:DNA-binding response OmpR family regulator